MHVISYQKYLRAKATIPLSILGIVLLLWLVIGLYCIILEERVHRGQKNVQVLEKDMKLLQDDIMITRNAYEMWSKVGSQGLATDGLQIEQAKQIIENLRVANQINKLNVSVSNPVARTDYVDAKGIRVEYSEITMNCSAYTDEAIFAFIDGLSNSLPGYIQIKNIEMSSSQSITPEILKAIAEGGYRDLVQAKMELIWQKVKAIQQEGQ